MITVNPMIRSEAVEPKLDSREIPEGPYDKRTWNKPDYKCGELSIRCCAGHFSQKRDK